MLTQQQREHLAKIHADTSDTVRIWITQNVASAQQGDPFAEHACKVFLNAYRKHGSGVRALAWMQEGEHEQLKIDTYLDT